MYAIGEQDFHQLLGNVPFIGEGLAKHVFQETLVFQWVTVIHIGLCNGKIQDLALVVNHDVQFEAVEPAHRGLAYGGNAFENLVPFVFADPDWGRIHKGYPVHFPKQQVLRKMAIGSTRLWLSSTNRLREIALHMTLHIEKIEMFKAPKAA